MTVRERGLLAAGLLLLAVIGLGLVSRAPVPSGVVGGGAVPPSPPRRRRGFPRAQPAAPRLRRTLRRSVARRHRGAPRTLRGALPPARAAGLVPGGHDAAGRAGPPAAARPRA